MSKGLFANPKAALTFAGVTVGFALLASFGAKSMVPDDADGRVDYSPEIEAAQAEDAAAKRAAREERRLNEPRLSWDGKKRVADWGARDQAWSEIEDGWGRDLQTRR